MNDTGVIPAQPRTIPHQGRWLWYGLVLLVVGGVALYFIDAYWPYRYRNVEPTLEKVFASKITMDHYHRTYFPYPGFVANGLTLRRNSAPNLPPVGTVERVRVEGRWTDLILLRRRIRAVYADGLHIVIPPVGSVANKEDFPPGSSNDFTGPTTAVGKFDMEGAMLEIMRTDGSRYSFPIRSLVIRHLQQNVAIEFSVDMQTPKPTGHILASGSFGPLRGNSLGATLVTGDFTYESVKLGEIGGIKGTLRSTGHFQGNLAAIEASSQSTIPDFAVGDGRPVAITGTFTGAVSALNGDVVLHAVDLELGKTVVHMQGQIAGAPKVTDLDLAVTKGRAEDLLHPFMKAQAPVVGPLRLHSHAHIAAAVHAEEFLQRLTMTGVFEAPSQRLTSASTERSLTAFSGRAQGESAEDAAAEQDVLSSLGGSVVIRNGVAHASQLTLEMPGASIKVNGAFDLRNQNVNMTGDLRMQSDISHVTTGFKSFLLKPFAPFFKRKGAGAVVPIAVTGSPQHYKIGQNFLPH